VKEGTPALSGAAQARGWRAEYGITHAPTRTTLRAMVGGENSATGWHPMARTTRSSRSCRWPSARIVDDIANLNIATGRQLADGTPEVVPLRAIATLERTFNPETSGARTCSGAWHFSRMCRDVRRETRARKCRRW